MRPEGLPIEARGLCKSFTVRGRWGTARTVPALRRFRLRLRGGEAFALMGPNGAGKSTAMRALAGLLAPDQGQAWLHGLPARDPRARQTLGYLPERAGLYASWSARDMVALAGRARGMRRREAKREALRALEGMGLGDRAHQPVYTLSRGMRQGAAVAHALVGRPRLLILDEPFSGLDPTWRQALLQQLAEMRNGGTTLLFSSHIVEDVERLADRVGLVCSGRIREITTTAALAQGLAQRYLIRSRGRAPLPAAWPIGRDQWLWEVPADGLWTALADLRAAGHQLMEVRPAGSVGERGCPSGPEPP